MPLTGALRTHRDRAMVAAMVLGGLRRCVLESGDTDHVAHHVRSGFPGSAPSHSATLDMARSMDKLFGSARGPVDPGSDVSPCPMNRCHHCHSRTRSDDAVPLARPVTCFVASTVRGGEARRQRWATYPDHWQARFDEVTSFIDHLNRGPRQWPTCSGT